MDVEPLAAAAQESTVVRRLLGFTEWVGAGCKFIRPHRITMADARIPVDRLGTGDYLDPQIGSRVFKTRSSQELPALDLVLERAQIGTTYDFGDNWEHSIVVECMLTWVGVARAADFDPARFDVGSMNEALVRIRVHAED